MGSTGRGALLPAALPSTRVACSIQFSGKEHPDGTRFGASLRNSPLQNAPPLSAELSITGSRVRFRRGRSGATHSALGHADCPTLNPPMIERAVKPHRYSQSQPICDRVWSRFLQPEGPVGPSGSGRNRSPRHAHGLLLVVRQVGGTAASSAWVYHIGRGTLRRLLGRAAPRRQPRRLAFTR